MGQSYTAIADGKRVQFSVTVEGGTGAEQTVGVTGANGFIGSHIVKQLLGKGYKVHGTVQDLSRDAVNFLKSLPYAENLSLFQGELLTPGCFDKAFEGCDGVFHLASPTLKDTEDMKNPETDMVEFAVYGTLNVLKSCKKMGVKSVILTSSMCAAIPKPDTPEVLLESHWADVEYLRDKGSYYAAAKTKSERAALEFVAEIPRKSAFRLVRICPTFTVGPMLQPGVNSSMRRFAAICRGTHHARIPNRSISLIDVRDTAAHHIAAYEGEHELRFFSLTEAWPWTLVYEALKLYCPGMKCPEPLPKGTQLRPVRKYNTTRRRLLGIRERSFLETLREAAEECEKKNLGGDSPSGCIFGLPLEAYLGIGGYYDIGLGSGTFFMIEVICTFTQGSYVVNNVQLSWLLEVGVQPTVVDITSNRNVNLENNVLTWKEKSVNLTFSRQDSDVSGIWTVKGSIGDTNFTGTSYLACVPFAVFDGKYSSKDSGQSISVRFREANNSITDFDGNQWFDFSYNPLQRRFFYQLGTDNYSLSFNAASGNGLVLTFVASGSESTRSTSTFYKFPSFSVGPVSSKPSVGANGLAMYAGYYPLSTPGKLALGFVSIIPPLGDTGVRATVSTAGEESTEYTSFVFADNKLKFASVSGLELTFEKTPSDRYGAYAQVTVEYNNDKESPALSFFSPVPITAYCPGEFDSITLSGSAPIEDGDYSLQIFHSGSDIQLKCNKDGNPIFDTHTYEYNSITQVATIFQLFSGRPATAEQYILNFAYRGDKGLTCEIIEPGSLQLLCFLSAVVNPEGN